MYQAAQVEESLNAVMRVHHETLQLDTEGGVQFIDITAQIAEVVAESGITHGWVNIQTQHTTTAIIINEHEPLLLEDMQDLLERFAPLDHQYRHNDFNIRTVNMQPDEQPNGHSHCRALFLRASETINVLEGQMNLGRWQRIFFVELDCPRQRHISVMIMGQSGPRFRVVRGRKA
ncbi:MAG: YjbQ family protein [Acidobacteria bacterium]|nr:YjbQ family protein [Acidobacteriota bacterium]MBI3427051.1 YjbQ family protein [Acidobacteriota bacterium]